MDTAIIDGVEPNWLETVTIFWNLRVWHLILFCIICILIIGVIVLIYCFRFRIRKTHHDIEADCQRRVIVKKFREHLAGIKNSEMDEMNLLKALDRVRHDFLIETELTTSMTTNKTSAKNLPQSESSSPQPPPPPPLLLTTNLTQTIITKNNDNVINREKIAVCV